MYSILEKVIFLQNFDVFAEVPTEQLGYVAAIAEEVTYLANDRIYAENDAPDAMYLVLEGSVRLHRGDEEILVARKGEEFGTWAIFNNEPRVTSATILEDARLLRIDRDEFMELLSDHTEITQGVFKTVVGRLRTLVDRVGPIRPRGTVE